MIWRVDLPLGSCVPERGVPTFAKDCLGIGSHRCEGRVRIDPMYVGEEMVFSKQRE